MCVSSSCVAMVTASHILTKHCTYGCVRVIVARHELGVGARQRVGLGAHQWPGCLNYGYELVIARGGSS